MFEYQLLNGACVVAYGDYYEALKEAEKRKLKLAEYGDVYGSSLSYCFYNQSGDRNQDEEIICYYRFNKSGKPEPISEEELHHYLFN